jgi:hypothetical protein
MTEDQAKRRFKILNLVRLGAVVCVFAGIANAGGKLFPDLAPGLGFVLMIIGMVDFFFAPILLKAYWRRDP